MCAALTLGAPTLAHAQYADNDRQNPTEYTDEDSQPLRMIAYIIAPVGFLLEWGVARPLHYVATNTPLAPVFNGDVRTQPYTPPAIAEIPLDDVGDEPVPTTEVVPIPEALPSPSVQGPSLSPRQPVLH